MKIQLINRSLQLQRQVCCKGHGHALGLREFGILPMAILAGILTLGVGCGKKEEAVPPVPPPQAETVQPAAPAPVQRQQYAPTPPPPPAAPVRQAAPASPAGVPMTRPAGSAKPVPVVP